MNRSKGLAFLLVALMETSAANASLLTFDIANPVHYGPIATY